MFLAPLEESVEWILKLKINQGNVHPEGGRGIRAEPNELTLRRARARGMGESQELMSHGEILFILTMIKTNRRRA